MYAEQWRFTEPPKLSATSELRERTDPTKLTEFTNHPKLSELAGRTHQSQDRAGAKGAREHNKATILRLERELAEIIAKRSGYNRNRYHQSTKELGTEGDLTLPSFEPSFFQKMDTNISDNNRNNSGINNNQLGILSWFQNQHTKLQQEISELSGHKQMLETTLMHLEKKTFGIQLIEDKNGRFIVLPQGKIVTTNWKVGKQEALRLE